MTYRFPIHVGDRVAIAPHHDLWMAGCRFGTVETSEWGSNSKRFYNVRLDTGLTVSLWESALLGAVGDSPYVKPPIVQAVEAGLTVTMDEVLVTSTGDTRCDQCCHAPGFHDNDEPDCAHEDCGYGECSWLQEGPVPGMCNTHGNGEGRCQQAGERQPDLRACEGDQPENEYGFVCAEFAEDGSCIHSEHMSAAGL